MEVESVELTVMSSKELFETFKGLRNGFVMERVGQDVGCHVLQCRCCYLEELIIRGLVKTNDWSGSGKVLFAFRKYVGIWKPFTQGGCPTVLFEIGRKCLSHGEMGGSR